MSLDLRRNTLKLAALVLTLTVIFVFIDTATGALWYSPDTEVPAPEREEALEERALPEDEPARLRVPKLGIDAFVQYVGVNAKGNMAAPSNFADVDRKSTRLNSSHSSISYAVFCLKKI